MNSPTRHENQAVSTHHHLSRLAGAVVAAGTLLVGCGSAGAVSTAVPVATSSANSSATSAAPSSGPAKSGAGSYVSYADYRADSGKYAAGDVVLFFYASWCPSCQVTEKDVLARRDSLPSGLTLVKVDYDSQVDLKKQYGVTTQHTFVQVDAQGNEVKAWNGSLSVHAIAAQLA